MQNGRCIRVKSICTGATRESVKTNMAVVFGGGVGVVSFCSVLTVVYGDAIIF